MSDQHPDSELLPRRHRGLRRLGSSFGRHGDWSPQFVVLLGVLVLAPLPIASNRPWALALVGALVCALFLWTLWLPEDGLVKPLWRGRPSLWLLAAWSVWLSAQLLPLPAPWLGALQASGLAGFPVRSGQAEPLSIDVYSTQLYLLKSLVLLALFWLLLRLVHTRGRIEALAWTVVGMGVAEATFGVLMYASGARYTLFFVDFDNLDATGTFVNRDHLAGYLEMTLAMGIGLMISKLRDDGGGRATWKARARDWLGVLVSPKARLRLLLVVMVIGLITTRSRMGNGAFFASMLVAGVIALTLSRHATRATVVFIASLIVLDVAIIGGVVGIEKVAQRIDETYLQREGEGPVDTGASRAGGMEARRIAPGAGHREESVEERSLPARLSLPLIAALPWTGSGGGTFKLSFQRVQPGELLGYVDHAHNDYVEFACDAGLPGLALLGAVVALSLARALIVLAARRDPLARGMAFAALMGILSILLHSLVDFNLQIPANAMLFLVLVALPYLVSAQSRWTAGSADPDAPLLAGASPARPTRHLIAPP